MDSLQEAFIHSLEPCEAHFIMDAHALFHVFWGLIYKAQWWTKYTDQVLE